MTKEERNRLVMENIKLVHFVVRKYYAKRAKRHQLEYDDLVSEGTIGLIKAIEKFDPSFGCKLTTYAVPMIIGEIQRLFRDYYSGPKYSRDINILRSKIIRAGIEDAQYDRIAEEFEATREEVASAISMIHGSLTFDYSIKNRKGETEKLSFYETIPDRNNLYDDVMLSCFVDTLPERDKFIFVNTLEDRTQAEIGHALGISQVQVSRLLKRIKTSMSEYLGGMLGEFIKVV